MGVAFPQLPPIKQIEEPALRWAAGRRGYNTDELKEHLAAELGLSPDLLALRRQDGSSAFGNRVDWLTAKWTMMGMHSGEKKVYKLTPLGKATARRLLKA